VAGYGFSKSAMVLIEQDLSIWGKTFFCQIARLTEQKCTGRAFVSIREVGWWGVLYPQQIAGQVSAKGVLIRKDDALSG